MASNIQTYELPDGAQHKAFQIYEVRGKTYDTEVYPYQPLFPHRHSYYEICVFINGSGKHEIDFQSYNIQPNSIHFLSPGQVHLIYREENYYGYLIVFSHEFYSIDPFHQGQLLGLPYFNNPHIAPIINLCGHECNEFILLIEMMKKEMKKNDSITRDILQSYLHIFLLKCKHYYEQYLNAEEEVEDPNFQLAQQFKSLVEENFCKFHLVQDYAERLSISSSALNRHLKRITGNTAGEILMDRLVLEAKRLLIYTRMSNNQEPFHLNYQHPSYFSSIFKKKTGFSPSDFRNEMRKKYQIKW
jgi:AraC family transcriptional regulator, transcriptional activator of pobA